MVTICSISLFNVQLDHNLSVKITDFGISHTSLTNTISVGNPRWMAPEYFDYTKQHGPEGDVFGFGVILWELVSKQHPWGLEHEHSRIISDILSGKRLEVPNTCPKKLAEIIHDCWKQGKKYKL